MEKVGVVNIIPLRLPLVKEGDDLAKLIVDSVRDTGSRVENGDVFVVAHKIVSRVEGRVISLNDIKPSFFAATLAEYVEKSPELVEVILRESRKIVKVKGRHLITETRHGFVCANAGVDLSNTPGEDSVTLLPLDPDGSAERIRGEIFRLTGRKVAVIVSDTHGRPFRCGVVNVALGVAGLNPLFSYVGKRDLFGYRMQHTLVAVADLLASAAALVIGQCSEGVPVALIRGFVFSDEEGSGKDLIRPEEQDIFR